TRYGKIEDMVVAMEVVLADGRVIRTGGAPRAAVGSDLNQVFVGSEGTLGVITDATLRAHPAPTADRGAVYGFPSFLDGLEVGRPRAARRRVAAGGQRRRAHVGGVGPPVPRLFRRRLPLLPVRRAPADRGPGQVLRRGLGHRDPCGAGARRCA